MKDCVRDLVAGSMSYGRSLGGRSDSSRTVSTCLRTPSETGNSGIPDPIFGNLPKLSNFPIPFMFSGLELAQRA